MSHSGVTDGGGTSFETPDYTEDPGVYLPSRDVQRSEYDLQKTLHEGRRGTESVREVVDDTLTTITVVCVPGSLQGTRDLCRIPVRCGGGSPGRCDSGHQPHREGSSRGRWCGPRQRERKDAFMEEVGRKTKEGMGTTTLTDPGCREKEEVVSTERGGPM